MGRPFLFCFWLFNFSACGPCLPLKKRNWDGGLVFCYLMVKGSKVFNTFHFHIDFFFFSKEVFQNSWVFYMEISKNVFAFSWNFFKESSRRLFLHWIFFHPRHSGEFSVVPTRSFHPGEGKNFFLTLGHFILGRQEFFPEFVFVFSFNKCTGNSVLSNKCNFWKK